MNILIAEDDRNFGLVLKRELEEEGYSVDVTVDGVETVMKFLDDADRYGILLLDIKMPKLDGINTLRIIKKIRPDILAITFSGNAGSGEMADSVKAGALRCLTKPFEISHLISEIKKHAVRVHGART